MQKNQGPSFTETLLKKCIVQIASLEFLIWRGKLQRKGTTHAH